MKKNLKYFIVVLALLFTFSLSVEAESKNIYVNLETLEYSTNQKDYDYGE